MKLKSRREFLEPLKDSDSYFRICVSDETGEVDLKLSDCDRRIWWYFGKPGNKRAIAKIKKIKAAIDAVHDYLVGAV